MRRGRTGEQGRGLGCVVAVLLIIVCLCLAAYLGGRIVAAPDLGDAPRGPDNGPTAGAIAGTLAASVVTQFLGHDHATVVLSEKDMTVLARDRNPDPERFQRPEVRVRDSFILLSAATTMGPLKTVSVARITVLLTGVADGSAHIETDIVGLKMGRLDIPDFMRASLDPRGNGALSLDPVFNDSSDLRALRSSLECIFIGTDGVHLGFHRAGVVPDPGSCHPTAVSLPQ